MISLIQFACDLCFLYSVSFTHFLNFIFCSASLTHINKIFSALLYACPGLSLFAPVFRTSIWNIVTALIKAITCHSILYLIFRFITCEDLLNLWINTTYVFIGLFFFCWFLNFCMLDADNNEICCEIHSVYISKMCFLLNYYVAYLALLHVS